MNSLMFRLGVRWNRRTGMCIKSPHSCDDIFPHVFGLQVFLEKMKNGIQLQSSLNKKASVVHGCFMTFFLITSDFVFKIHIDTLI